MCIYLPYYFKHLFLLCQTLSTVYNKELAICAEILPFGRFFGRETARRAPPHGNGRMQANVIEKLFDKIYNRLYNAYTQA